VISFHKHDLVFSYQICTNFALFRLYAYQPASLGGIGVGNQRAGLLLTKHTPPCLDSNICRHLRIFHFPFSCLSSNYDQPQRRGYDASRTWPYLAFRGSWMHANSHSDPGCSPCCWTNSRSLRLAHLEGISMGIQHHLALCQTFS
jgi:hypothetical protein